MSPRSRVWGACRTLAIRTRPQHPRSQPFSRANGARRLYSDDTRHEPTKPIDGAGEALTASQKAQDVSATDSEATLAAREAEETEAVTANEGTTGSITDALDDATLERIFYGGRSPTSSNKDALTDAQEQALYREGSIPPPAEAEALARAVKEEDMVLNKIPTPAKGGLKFPPPLPPTAEGFHLKKRYHPVLEQISRLLMRDGKLSVAQRNVAMIMNYLRTSPAPIYSPKFPLLPGTPPASHLPLNPVLYMTIAIDSVAPLLKIRNFPGAGGGGRALEVPVPLAVRQRRRTAFNWILDVVNKKPSKGSGRTQFPHRIAEEIIAVVEGRSAVWEKRRVVHKLGTASRANVGSNRMKKKKM